MSIYTKQPCGKPLIKYMRFLTSDMHGTQGCPSKTRVHFISNSNSTLISCLFEYSSFYLGGCILMCVKAGSGWGQALFRILTTESLWCILQKRTEVQSSVCFVSCYCIVADDVNKQIGFHRNALLSHKQRALINTALTAFQWMRSGKPGTVGMLFICRIHNYKLGMVSSHHDKKCHGIPKLFNIAVAHIPSFQDNDPDGQLCVVRIDLYINCLSLCMYVWSRDSHYYSSTSYCFFIVFLLTNGFPGLKRH